MEQAPAGEVVVDALSGVAPEHWPAGVAVGRVVRADVQHIIAPLQHARKRPEPDVKGGAVPADGHHPGVGSLPLALKRRRHSGGHRGAVFKDMMNPGHTPGRVAVGGTHSLQTAGGGYHDNIGAGGLK